MTDTRICNKCFEEKAIDGFRLIKTSNYRLLKCRECERAQQRVLTKAYKQRKKAERLAQSAGGILKTIGGPDIWETVRGIEARLQKIEAALTNTTET